MKYGKFLDVAYRHPFVRALVREHATCRADVTDREVKWFVRKGVEYIAFRPWDKLLLSEGSAWVSYGLIPGHMAFHFVKHVKYAVYFTIGGQREPLCRSVADEFCPDRSDERTVAAVIEHLRRWHQENFSKGEELRFLAVVRITQTGGMTSSPKSFEIFPFPDGYK